MKYYLVDAFSATPFGGNPAGVVLLGSDGRFPANELMVQVAAELRYSETAFVRQDGPTEFTVRYFTPRAEVNLCGHATIAAFGTLYHEGIVPDGAVCINHTLAGDLEVRPSQHVMMQMATPSIADRRVDTQRLEHAMFGDDILPTTDWPIEIVSTGLPDIIMPVATIDKLNALSPDMNALATLSQELGVTGVHAFALGADNFTAHVRNFGPLYGIPEESATGTANAALTHYLFRRGFITLGATCRFVQGEAMGRRSIVTTVIHEDGDIYVGGECCIIARGELLKSKC
jgi:PhzF family phenazine biosynthesis protein